MGADALAQVPDADHASAIAADELALVGVDDHVVDGSSVDVVTLETAGAGVPDLDSSILRAGDHPLALAVESNASDVVGVTLEGHHWVGVGGFDVVEPDIAVACGCKVALVGSDAEAIDLGVRVLDGTRADTGQRLPEADGEPE